MNLESFDIVKSNVDQSDDALETVIGNWCAKDKALELCARSLAEGHHASRPAKTLARLDNGRRPIFAHASSPHGRRRRSISPK